MRHFNRRTHSQMPTFINIIREEKEKIVVPTKNNTKPLKVNEKNDERNEVKEEEKMTRSAKVHFSTKH